MANHEVIEKIDHYIAEIQQAKSEEAKKALFQSLLERLFGDSPASRALLTKMASGGEQTIFNIPRDGKSKTGRADVAYDNVIIEWEKDLAKTGKHAEDQLAEYLAGKWHSGQEYDYTLIATDGRVWRSYVPDLEILLGQNTPDRTALRKIQDFEVKKNQEEKFFHFLDRLFFRSTRRKATLDEIQLAFGDTSRVFINTLQVMREVMPALEQDSPVHVAFEQWQRFLQLAYGKFDDRRTVYLVHTYLSVFSKLLAYAVLQPQQEPDDDKLRSILTGQAFHELNVSNFVEGDFFFWISDEKVFKKILRPIRQIYEAILNFDFTDVEEDILKGVYQELIDIDTRHALGEYYTPDWLCEKVVEHVGLERHSQTLDPACGSGSFLRALVAKFRKDWPDMGVEQIARQVTGIDVHPLSVQIAKTTLLLAFGDSISRAKQPIELRVYLANTLFLSQDEGKKTLYSSGYHFMVKVDEQKLPLDMGPFIGQPARFSEAIELAQYFVDQNQSVEQTYSGFATALKKRIAQVDLADHNIAELYGIYKAMRLAKIQGRDSIWQFVLQNLYQPVFMHRTFDVIVANPPWLTYSDITSGDYQTLVRDIARNYNLLPKSKANNPHVDLAAVFLSHCGKYLAKADAQLAFVLPRSFFVADQHHSVRSGQASGFKLTEAWDLNGVQPLFNVPSCVLFADARHKEDDAAARERMPTKTGIVGEVFSGRLPKPHMHWSDASELLEQRTVRWYLRELGAVGSKKKRSALTTDKAQIASGANAYAKRFKQGATIVPRAFYFVKTTNRALKAGEHVQDHQFPIATHPLALEGAKKPWTEISLEGRMPGRFLFRTALARNVLPFALINPALVALPVSLQYSDGEYGTWPAVDRGGSLAAGAQWAMLSAKELAQQGEIEASAWFDQCEKLWMERRSDSAIKQKSDLLDWLNWQNKLTDQPVSARWAVMYTASATDASACVLDFDKFAQPFVAESTCYIAFLTKEFEAYYVTAYLNSRYINLKIKDFQARGLFGPRHIHKKVLELPWPIFNSNLASHRRLAKLAQTAAEQVQISLGSQQDLELDPRTLGRLRSQLRTELAPLMAEIDQLVEAISTGKDVLFNANDWNQFLSAKPGKAQGAMKANELSAFLKAERATWDEREQQAKAASA